MSPLKKCISIILSNGNKLQNYIWCYLLLNLISKIIDYFLQSEVVDLNDALQSSASNVLNKGEDLVEARRVEKNIQVSIEKLTQCLPVFSTYAKLQKQMKDKR